MSCSSASKLVGANPTGSLQRISLAVRAAVDALELNSCDALIVACSGGADSLSLAITAADHCQRRKIPCFSLTVDHGVRPESFTEATVVAGMLRRLGLRARAAHSRMGEAFSGPEGDARSLRYQLFESMGVELQKRGYQRVVIMLGHTAEDQAETVLLRLSRGSGVSSLRGMSSLRSQGDVLISRPLLGVRRADTRQACAQLGVEVVEDPTNRLDGAWRTSSGDPLRRSAVRHRAIPELARALGQDPIPALARTAQLAADDDDALEYYAGLSVAQAVVTSDSHSCVLNVEVLSEIPVAVRRRVFRRVCLGVGARPGDLNERHLNSVNALIDHWKGQGPLDLPGIVVVRKQGLISLRQR